MNDGDDSLVGRLVASGADMNGFDPGTAILAGAAIDAGGAFDRVVSVEMFEHMRTYELLLRRIAGWLEPAGLLFVHIFAHRAFAYPYLDEGPSDWMARHFFTGGQMPSHGLLRRFDRDLHVVEDWRVNGSHYARTLEAWLVRMDGARNALTPILRAVHGSEEAVRWRHQWRVFFLACAELFAYRGGEE